LKSGVHATLAGVVLAFFIPMKGEEGAPSPLKSLEHNLHSLVAFIILPVFAFANAGISFTGIGIEQVMAPVPGYYCWLSGWKTNRGVWFLFYCYKVRLGKIANKG
jgi:NhaA family Na+:H+ antiporter